MAITKWDANPSLTSGLAGIYWAERGLIKDAEFQEIGLILLGTGQFTGDDVTETKIETEQAGVLGSTFKNGTMGFEGDIPSLSMDLLQKMLVGEKESVTHVKGLGAGKYIHIGVGSKLPKLDGMFMLKFDQGATAVVFTNASMVSKVTGTVTSDASVNIHSVVSSGVGGDGITYEKEPQVWIYPDESSAGI